MHIDHEKQFNDPVAAKTSWQPLRKGGSSFKTYNLVTISASRIEFRATWYAILFYLIFIGVGSGLVIASLYNVFIDSIDFESFDLIQFIVGIMFLVASVPMAIKNIMPIVFDKTFGYYWTGYRRPHYTTVHKKPEIFFRTYDIHALQLISELIKGDKRSYNSYELNIIFHDGRRKNLVDHGNIEKLRKEAEELAQFINRPLWDNTLATLS